MHVNELYKISNWASLKLLKLLLSICGCSPATVWEGCEGFSLEGGGTRQWKLHNLRFACVYYAEERTGKSSAAPSQEDQVLTYVVHLLCCPLYGSVSQSALSSGCKDALISLTDLGSRLMEGGGLHWACLQNQWLRLEVSVNQSKSSCEIAASPWMVQWCPVGYPSVRGRGTPGLQAGSSSRWGGHALDQQGLRADFLSERLTSYFQQWDYY